MADIRRARLADDAALAEIDAATWTATPAPAPAPPGGTPFYGNGTRPEDVLVAEADGVVVGYVKIGQGIRLPSHQHVLDVQGLAVDTALRCRGFRRLLLDAAVMEARRRGARKLSLRVLSSNDAARRLYAASGFLMEGILRGEFFLAGAYVDDVLMARRLEPHVP